MGDSPISQHQGVSGGLEARLERYARAMGGSSDPAAGASGAAGGEPMSGQFARAVAGRRVGIIAKAGLGGVLAVGVIATIVMVASRPSHVPARPTPRYGQEPTYWNLQRGVQDPGAMDSVPGLESGSGAASEASSPGVAPASWPADLRP